ADYRAEFVKAVVIARDRAGADIGARSHLAVADVGEVIGFGSDAEPSSFNLDEIADMHLFFKDRSRPQPRERTTERDRSDRGALEMRERVNPGPLADGHPGAEGDVGFDHDIAGELRVGAEEYGLGRNEGHPRFHYRAAEPALHRRFSLGQ